MSLDISLLLRKKGRRNKSYRSPLTEVRGMYERFLPLTMAEEKTGEGGSRARATVRPAVRKEPGSERAHHSRVRPAGTLRCVRRQSPASEQPFGHAPTSAACSAFKSTAPAGSAQHSVFSRRNTAMQLHRSAAPALQDRIGLGARVRLLRSLFVFCDNGSSCFHCYTKCPW